jgi:predicted dehydrogenase
MVGTGLETPQEGVITVAGERGTLQLDANSQVQLVVGQRRDALPAEPVPEGELGRALTLFADAIRSGRPPETGVEDNVRSLLLLLAVLESSRSRRPVAVSDLLGQLG